MIFKGDTVTSLIALLVFWVVLWTVLEQKSTSGWQYEAGSPSLKSVLKSVTN